MILRDARPEDAGAITAYWNPQIRETAITFTTLEKDPETLAQEITARRAEGRAFLVACDGAQILGHAAYFPFRSGPGYRHTAEHTIILDPAQQGRGVASPLLQALEKHAREAGIHSMIAGISGENGRAIAFHEKAGYRHAATIPEAGRKFDRWMDLVLMQKFL